jgi:type II secretory pathway component GspD/PulD (secretin)
MKFWFLILVLLTGFVCAQAPQAKISKRDRKQADKDFRKVLELQKSGQTEDALKLASEAVDLVPADQQYLTARETLRQEMAAKYLERGNLLANAGDGANARAQFLAALALDPENTYLQQRLRDVSPAKSPEEKHVLELLASVEQVEVIPAPGKQSFHIHGDTRSLYDQIGRAFNVTMQYDPALPSRPVQFDLANVDFFDAMSLAGKATKTFWAPLSEHQAIVAPDSPELHLAYDRMSMRTFYLNDASSIADVNDIAALLRSIFEVRFISVQPAKNTITLRAPREQLDAISIVLDNLLQAKPEVLFEVQAYEVNTDEMRKVGLNAPNDFQIFSIAAEIYRILGSNAGPIIDQISRTGTVDPATIPKDAFSKLQGSPLLSPFVFFGKGLGLTGITVNPLHVQLSRNSASSSTLERVHLRAMDGEPAIFRSGTRFPIVNSIFTGVTVDAKGNPTIGPSVPSVTYEDLGVTLKSTPHYHRGDEVTLDLELSIKTLGASAFAGLPPIITREYKGNITVRDGEAAVVTGALTEQHTKTTSGYPAIGQIPFLNTFTNANTKEFFHQEILVVVTPHVLRKPFRDAGSDVIWSMSR